MAHTVKQTNSRTQIILISTNMHTTTNSGIEKESVLTT